MIRNHTKSKLLPLAMTVALAGTSWIGLAGGPAAPEAQAQRAPEAEKNNDERERRSRGERQRPERPDRAQPARPDQPRGAQPGRAERGGSERGAPERRERRERAAPTAEPRRTPQPPAAQTAPAERQRPDMGRQAPKAEQPQQRQVPPRADERRGAGEERGRERGRPAQFERREPQQRPSVPSRADDRRDEGKERGRMGQPDRQQAPGQRPAIPPRADERRGGPEQGRERGPDRGRVGQPEQRDGRPGDRPRFGGPGGPGGPRGERRFERPQRVGPARLEDVRKGRVERVEGGRRVIEEPGNRFIIRDKNRVVIRRDEGRAFERYSRNARSRDLGDGRRETWFERPDGTRVYTEVDRSGRMLRRWRRDRSGREVILIDNRRHYRDVAVGIGALGVAVGLALAPPPMTIPRNKYIVDYEDASDEDLYEALSAPPLGRLERGYSLDEIRYSSSVRDYMRRIDLDTVNFEFGSFEVGPDQYPKLERLARIIHRMLERNEAEMFLIEGHTDAVGSDEDNLTLSDRRAESVADILVSEFDVPIENLVTQGYGEQHLKIQTEAAERQNRRVAVRRITPLLGDNR